MEQRRSPRFPTRFDALIAAGRQHGAGELVEISYAGARLEHASTTPPIGARVTLYVFVAPVSPFEITGQVARHTETGFAVSYDLFDADIRCLVDDVAALVPSRRTG
jgi:hypothetical protein